MVTKKLSSLNDKVAYEYSKYDTEIIQAFNLAKNYFEKNGRDASLIKLKQQLDNINDKAYYHIYLIDKNYIIKNTTYTPDINLDFHLLPETLKTLNKVFNNPNYIDLSSVISDMINNSHKKYIVQKAKNQDYLIQISFNLKNYSDTSTFMNNMSKQIPNIIDTSVYLVFLENIQKINFNLSKNYTKKNKLKKINEENLYHQFSPIFKNEKNYSSKEFKNYISEFAKNGEYKNRYFYRDEKYIHQVIMPFYSYLNADEDTMYLISIEFDESEAKQTMTNINIIAFIIFVTLVILTVFLIFIINNRIVRYM